MPGVPQCHAHGREFRYASFPPVMAAIVKLKGIVMAGHLFVFP
jgi:hypothetical protein